MTTIGSLSFKTYFYSPPILRDNIYILTIEYTDRQWQLIKVNTRICFCPQNKRKFLVSKFPSTLKKKLRIVLALQLVFDCPA